MKVLVLSGPNLHRLGKREPEVYGHTTLPEVHRGLEELGRELGVVVECRQSNHEGDLVGWIGSAEEESFAAILINPGAYTHTSYALLDAVRGAGIPTVEVHISNPEAREEFRRHSRIAPGCLGKVAGFGVASYGVALRALVEHIKSEG
jgi:3-dehydroquinate dehydratase II